MSVQFSKIFKDHNDWANKNLPKRTSISVFHNLTEEVDELRDCLFYEKSLNEAGLEIADNILMLVSLADKMGISAELLESFLVNKININKERKFMYLGDGIYKHIK